ncbi:hypothetical protein V7968_32665 [Nocardia vulneris]|uniref:hypothetical protein n=1 Tax=Nocardia vulneris TaxID=1141657 RepID=UPI0030D14A23
MYESELALVTDETLGHLDIETGGSLFGLFSHGGGPTVFLATRPAGKFRKASTSLELDPGVTRTLEEVAWKRFGVQCIGMWHSHHWIGLMEPSNGDRERTRRYAQRYDRSQYTEILANFVGERSSQPNRDAHVVQLTPFFYLDARDVTRAEATIEVLPGISPLRRALAEYRSDARLSGALAPAGHLREGSYRLAGSSGTSGGARGLRRLLGGKAERSGPQFYDEVADDQRGLTGSGKPGELSTVSPKPEECQPGSSADDGRPPGPPDDGRQDEQEIDQSALTLQSPMPERISPDRSQALLPIPDLADFVTRYVEPVMQRLAGRYEVRLEIVGTDCLAVVVNRYGCRTRAVLHVGWNGAAAVVAGCEVISVSWGERWPQGPGPLKFEGPLQWSLGRLDRLS